MGPECSLTVAAVAEERAQKMERVNRAKSWSVPLVEAILF
jgi:hypothetical protein